MKTFNEILEALESMDKAGKVSDLVAMWNTYAIEEDPDREIFENDDDFFNEILSGCSGLNVACRVYFGNWSPVRPWVAFDGYANLAAFEFLTESGSPYDAEELAWYICKNPENFSHWLNLGD